MASSSQSILLSVKLKRLSPYVTWNTWCFSSTLNKDLFITKPCKGYIKNPLTIRDLNYLFLQRLLEACLMRRNFWPTIFLLRLYCFSCCHPSPLSTTATPFVPFKVSDYNASPKNYVQPEHGQPWKVLCLQLTTKKAHVQLMHWSRASRILGDK